MGSGVIAILRNPLIAASIPLFAISFTLDKLGIAIPYVHRWLDDLLALPLSLAFILIVQRGLTYRNPAYVLPLWQVVATTVLFAVWFEWLLPQSSPTYTADRYDVLMYALGAMLFELLVNKPADATT